MKTIYTIGHSNHDTYAFISLLTNSGITALADVRSNPYSRFAPQYSREALKVSLSNAGISYVFLGKELGARSDNPACYIQGRVQYDRLAKEPKFSDGIKRIIQGIEKHRIALMCSEKDPVECHRALLVARKIYEIGFQVNHILADGTIEPHAHMESRLLIACKLPEGDMFKSREECIAEAYTIQGARVAYQDKTMADAEQAATL